MNFLKKWWSAVKENVQLREKLVELERQLEAAEWLYAQAVVRHEAVKGENTQLRMAGERHLQQLRHLAKASRNVMQHARFDDTEGVVVLHKWKAEVYSAEQLSGMPVHIEKTVLK